MTDRPADNRAPAAVITSTLLTLVMVPALYSYLVRERRAARPAFFGEPLPGLAGGVVLPPAAPADRG